MLDALTFDAGSTLTPDYMLMLDSRDITGNISDRLMSMTLTDSRGFEADQLDIELNDADGQVGLPVRGAVLTVYIGWKGFALVCKTMTSSGRSATYEASRSEEASHADLAWATMHALLNEPLTAGISTPLTSTILEFY